MLLLNQVFHVKITSFDVQPSKFVQQQQNREEKKLKKIYRSIEVE